MYLYNERTDILDLLYVIFFVYLLLSHVVSRITCGA